MPPTRRQSADRLPKRAAKDRLRNAIIAFIAEQKVQGVKPKDIAPVLGQEFGVAFSASQVTNLAYRYVNKDQLEEARRRLEQRAITTAAKDQPVPAGMAAQTYAERAKDSEAVLGRVAEIFFTTADDRMVVQAGEFITKMCGHTVKPGGTPGDSRALEERAEQFIQRAVAETGEDRETAIAEICRRVPEFTRWAHRLKMRAP